MTDHADKSTEEKVSEFIIGTCQLLPKSFIPTSDFMHDLTLTLDLANTEYSFLCGSQAEFFIRPLNNCIGDTDIMLCKNGELASTAALPVLPSDMTGLAETIECYRIQSYKRYPGFVRLRNLGEMNYNWKNKIFKFNKTVRTGKYQAIRMVNPEDVNFDKFQREMLKDNKAPTLFSGPAVKSQTDSHFHLGTDTIKSIFCPHWPREAIEWSIRSRKHGWPTNDTISVVVHNGCHAVYVQHRACRGDEFQWRLSFSIAEVSLLQSWTQLQQIVYHLLRFFAKRELIEKDCPKEDEVLCTYHLKTLMLWICEEKPPEWWYSCSVIAICCELLKLLSEWLERKRYPNYFIPEANLFHEPLTCSKLHQTRRVLNEFQNSGILSHWLLENYILPTTQAQFQFLNTRKVKPHFMDYMAPLLQYRRVSELYTLDFVLSILSTHSNKLSRRVLKHGISSGLHPGSNPDRRQTVSLNSKMHSLMAFHPIIRKSMCFRHYDNVQYILQTTYGLRYGEISWDGSLFVEFITGISMQSQIIRSKYHNCPKPYTVQSTRFQFQRAQDLMRNLTRSNYNSCSEAQILSVLSEECLRKALEYNDSKSNGIAPAALAYLAALRFARSDYQQTIRFCLAVIANQSSETDKETLNAGCLLFIDGVARLVGLRALHQKTTCNDLDYIGKRLYLDLRLSSKVFTHYLAVLSAESMSSCFHLQHDLLDSVFPMDKYLKASITPKCNAASQLGNYSNATRHIDYCRRDSLTDYEATTANPVIVKEIVIKALMEYALENITSFYRNIRADFDVTFITGDCYLASYLHKCRMYDKTLHLCELILHEPDLNNNAKRLSMANVLLIPPFDSFFDGDVQSLLGFHTLFYFLSPHNDDTPIEEVTGVRTFERWFSNYVYLHRSELFGFVQLGYPIKCHYFLGRHFLAKYLKVRCCIDCGLPYADSMAEFTAHKANLPFEHVIRRFLERKYVLKKAYKLFSCENMLL